VIRHDQHHETKHTAGTITVHVRGWLTVIAYGAGLNGFLRPGGLFACEKGQTFGGTQGKDQGVCIPKHL